MDRHKKYTQMYGAEPGGKKQGNTPSVNPPDENASVIDSIVNTQAVPSGSHQSYFEELNPYDVNDDPDFPTDLQDIFANSQTSTTDVVVPSQTSSGILFQHLTSTSGTNRTPTKSHIEKLATNHSSDQTSQCPVVIKSEPVSPRRPTLNGSTNTLQSPSSDTTSYNLQSVYGASPGPSTCTVNCRPKPAGMTVVDPQPGPSKRSEPSNPFNVSTSLISAVPMVQQASELQDLGLTVYNQDDLEEGIIAQVDKALAVQEQQRHNKVLEKEQKIVADELKAAKEEVAKLDKVLQMFLPQKTNKEVNRRLAAVSQQKENKLKQIKKLKAKLKFIVVKLTGSAEGLDDDEEEADLQPEGAGQGTSAMQQALGAANAETDYQRMIRLGEMTPFGTVMGFEDPVLSAHKPKRPKALPKPKTLTSGNSEFDDFLRGQQQKSLDKNKKKPLLKRCRTESSDLAGQIQVKQEPDDGSPQSKRKDMFKPREATQTKTTKPNIKSDKHHRSKSGKHHKNRVKGLRKSASEPIIPVEHSHSSPGGSGITFEGGPGLELGREGNLYDNKDNRVYRPKERDFSRAKSRKMRKDQLDHNFVEDGEVSDFEVGDEDRDQDVCSPDDDQEYRPEDTEEDVDSEEADVVETDFKKGHSKHIPPICVDNDDEFVKGKHGIKRKAVRGKRSGGDDATLAAYEKRLKNVAKEREKEADRRRSLGDEGTDSGSDMEFDRGFMVPGRIWNKLYRYQKTGVRWMWELHCQQSGGIVGDEMGLGKTIQIIAFLTGLKESKLRDKGANTKYAGLGPTIIITPATVMHQWVKEFHKWWPSFRVAVLHSSGSYTTSEEQLVFDIVKHRGILLTAFSTVVIHQDLLHKYDWHYVILDEGHKIRNPDAQVTLACKTFRTCHRLILSGSPMQNNLKELWSLFDFVFPGKLGTLPDFMAHFSIPIVQGGYSNATDVQVQTAYKCACVLRDTINPYLLRRMKSDVQNNIQLPAKNEQVLFCRLTEHQKDVYKEYLESRECKEILDRNFMVFPGLITLRKVCNHPDISTGGPKVFDPELLASNEPSLEYGYWKRSGKMIVVESLLKLWKKQGHRVLLFSQSRMMLDIFESFVQKQGYSFMRMDGGTTIASRQPLIQKYNEDETIFLFLLTTRVGGLGVNLTGANRVVIFDPDWNPSTDTQARERSWRIGQTKEVTIYRLLTTGTIEEKIYHRQIFKQFLANRVLKDPKQRRFFKTNDLYDLFTLGDDDLKTGTETSAIFAGTGTDVSVNLKQKERPKQRKSGSSGKVNRFDLMQEKKKEIKKEVVYSSEEELIPGTDNEAVKEESEDSPCTAEERLAKMRELAKRLSQKISNSLPEGANREMDMIKMEAGASQPSGKSHSSSKKKNKSKKEKKKKRNQKEDAELDGEKISNLDRHGSFHKQNEEEDDHKTSDAYVLGKLLKKKGVHSALQHDKIMMSSDPDYSLVEAEADRVAKEAARALKNSRARCLRAETGMPTWTGQSGGLKSQTEPKPRFGKKKSTLLAPGSSTANGNRKCESLPKAGSSSQKEKAKEENHFDGSLAGSIKTSGVSGSSRSSQPVLMSSDELMTRMKARNYYKDHPTEVGEGNDVGGDGISHVQSEQMDPESMELMTDIRNCIAFGCAVDGQATTQELLHQFEAKLPSRDSAKFRAMLKSICDLQRRDGIGIWKLKQEFR